MRALGSLGLHPEVVPTQIVARDRHAGYFAALARLGTAIERMALTVRHWQRTEVGEASEAFGKGQKGSSAMPHKKNPILSENLCGLARLLRHYAGAAFENVALWHERDISHSSVERVIGPDATGIADFMVRRAAGLDRGAGGRPRSACARTWSSRPGSPSARRSCWPWSAKGKARQPAYELVQKHALAAIGSPPVSESGWPPIPRSARSSSAEELARCFDLEHHLRFSDRIIDRALAESIRTKGVSGHGLRKTFSKPSSPAPWTRTDFPGAGQQVRGQGA